MKSQLFKSKKMTTEISMGEGNTPLIRLSRLEKILDWKGFIWAKCEFQNPTGSFKDRGSVAEIKQALKLKKKGVVCASTGNMAASLSAYAARVGLACFVVVPKVTPMAKLRQAIISGARIIEVDGNYDLCVDKAIVLAKKKNLLLCGDYKIRRNGQKTIGAELAKSKIKFDAFICPVGNGTVGCAIAEGFFDKKQKPMFIGVQGKGADPLVESWQNNRFIELVSSPQTIASAMNVGNPLDGQLTLKLVQQSKGLLCAANDNQIMAAQKLLARTEGIFVESAAAATVASLKIMPPEIKKLRNIVLIMTGSGLKENI